MPRTDNLNSLSFRHKSWFHSTFRFFMPSSRDIKAEIVKAKITLYFKEKSIAIDIGKIDRYKNPLSFLTAIDKLIEAGIFTPEKFNLLEAMDRDKPEKYIQSFNEILFLLKENDFLHDESFKMAYEKIDKLPSEEMFILESVICELKKNELLDSSAIAYLHVCEIDQFRVFSVIQHCLKNDVDCFKQLFTIEPSKLESFFGSADFTNVGEVREILEKNKTDQPATRLIFGPRL